MPDLLLDRLAKNASTYAKKKAVAFLAPGKDGGKIQRELTYAQVEAETSALASLLLEKGLKHGDRALLVYPPSLDFMLAFLACLKAGVVAVPVFPPNPARKDTLLMFSRITESCGAQIALTSTEYNHMKKLAGVKDAFTRFAATRKANNATWPEQLTWITTDNASPKDSNQKLPTPKPSDLAFLQFTSGSTSEPKGVMITHGNLAHNLTIITNDLKAKDDTIVASWLPQYHDMGLIGSYLGCLYCGGTGYYLSPLTFLQRPMIWLEAISNHKATHLQAPNFAFKLVARKFDASQYTKDALKLDSVRHVINAAEPVDEDSMETFYKCFAPFGFPRVIFPTYGLAESTVFVCSGGTQRLTVDKSELEVNGKVVIKVGTPAENDTLSRMIGCGYPKRQGVDVRIVETDSGKLRGEDVVGEIWVSSDSKAAGYFNKPKETKEDFHATLAGADNDGSEYLRTGDLGGEEVALIMELKEVPASKSAIEEVGNQLANSIKAAINTEHSLSIAQIVFLQPRTVPKTSSGKIARAWCRKGFLAGTLTVVYRKSFTKMGTMEIESNGGTSPPPPQQAALAKDKIDELRAMDRKDIVAKLVADVNKMGGSLDPSSGINNDSPIVTFLDSLTISQFKGLLESNYATRLSDEYLFLETTTLNKLAEVVKLGYAPDDDLEGNGEGRPQGVGDPGRAKGIAGMLGCPPGVVLCIIQ
ncbi:Putative fatty-acid--CoA ligase FadD21 [Seminavis robusta]|uniref:Fatty-acid--CoA ligase FadD21 n=1 Tax=Seminavis robusta TaxID=568900 RepID=A0A9N8EUM7_9STRA|nr:Putative fatty-acid--CoA ligase FadD21 [Seminavis robusta]|eukprot:Sro2001_g310290.1 Putative fatty-acid--CoA ligase FadD21 (701) ;mRNA; r:3035-5544